jgi:hypothetical protein
MSYAPTTDFLTLLRQTSGGAEFARMPGLDFAVSALARTGMFRLSTGQTAPTVNQSATAWFKPALPSWTAEGVLYLWNASTGTYDLATPALWTALIEITRAYSFQSVVGPTGVIDGGTSLLAVQRVAPASTVLSLPSLAEQSTSGRKLQIVDFSVGVISHAITLIATGGVTIMQRSSWQLLSTSDQLTGVTLQPSPELNSWVIAP